MSEEQPVVPRLADGPVAAPDAEPEQPEGPEGPEQPEPAPGPRGDVLAGPPPPVQVRLRRAPRYRAFVAVGALAGAVLGVVLALVLGGGDSLFSGGTVVGYLGAIGLLLGALLGAGAAVLLERGRR